MDELDEQVLVVRRKLVDMVLGQFQGLVPNSDTRLLPMLLAEGTYLPRKMVEADPTFKQIIPYVILTWQGKVLHYVRGKGGEKRLNAKGSIGIGGHMNPTDLSYGAAMEREVLHEELVVNTEYKKLDRAFLNDDSNDVGEVHLGVVHVFHLELPEVKAGEAKIGELQFLSLTELAFRYSDLESWSQICANHLSWLLQVT